MKYFDVKLYTVQGLLYFDESPGLVECFNVRTDIYLWDCDVMNAFRY